MCGLFGYSASKAFLDRIDPAQLVVLNCMLATAMDKRGGDGWGHADFSYDWREPFISKGIGCITPQITRSLSKRAFSRIGHTRKRTTGAESIRNSHPFVVGSIVGVHNGIIYNHTEVAKDLGVEVEVDSEVVFHAIDKKMDLSKISGYGAIVYASLDIPGVTYMGRFNNGQLAIWGVGSYPNPDMVIWASTKEAAEDAIDAAGLKGFPYTVSDNKLYYVEGSKLFTNDEVIAIEGFRHIHPTASDNKWASYWECYKKDAATLPFGEDKKKDTESGVHDEPSLSVLWKKFTESTRLDFEDFLAKATQADCEICKGNDGWFWFDLETELFLCTSCATDLEIDFMESLSIRDVKRLSWSYAQQQQHKHLTAGWTQGG